METITTNQEVYMVIGVEQTGSGSLTWPESFDVVGACFNHEDAQACADAKNKEIGWVLLEDGDLDEDADQPDEDERMYFVETLAILISKK